MGDDEEGGGAVGDPGEAAEVGEEGEGAGVGGGRRRDEMRWVEGERQRRQLVRLPHRGGRRRGSDAAVGSSPRPIVWAAGDGTGRGAWLCGPRYGLFPGPFDAFSSDWIGISSL